MGKSKRSDKEFSKFQELAKENQGLKRQIAALHKQLSRLDLDRYSQVKDIIQEHYHKENKEDGKNLLERLKEEWKCNNCHSGFLEIVIFAKINEDWYFRKCNNCTKRTKSQKYSSNVKGIIKQSLKTDVAK